MVVNRELAQELIDTVTSLLDCPDADVKGIVRSAREVLAEIEGGVLALEPSKRVSWMGQDGVYRFGTLTGETHLFDDGEVRLRAYGTDGNFYGIRREWLLDPAVAPEYACRPCVECGRPVAQIAKASPAYALCEDHAVAEGTTHMMTREEFVTLYGDALGWD